MSSSARGALHLAISSAVFMVSGYVINVLLGRLLGPSAYGVYGVVIALMTTINILQTSGLPQSLAHEVAGKGDETGGLLKTALIIQLVFGAILALLFYAFAPVTASLLGDSSLTPYLQLISLIFPAYGLFTVFFGYYNGKHQFVKQAVINNAYSIAKAVFVVVLALKFGLMGAIAGFIISPLVALLAAFHRPNLRAPFISLRPLLVAAIPLTAFALISTVQLSVDLFLLKRLVHDSALAGYYTAAQNIARIPFYGLSALGVILFPRMAKLISENKREQTAVEIAQIYRVAWLILIPTTVIIAAMSPLLLKIMFSSAFLPASSVLTVLSLAYIPLTLFWIFVNALNGGGETKFALIATGLAVGLCAVMSFTLIPAYGMMGAAVASLVSGSLAWVLVAWRVKKMFGASFPLTFSVKAVMAGVLAAAAPLLIAQNMLTFPIILLLALGAYILVLYLLKAFAEPDLRLLTQILPKRWRLQ